MNFTQLQIPTVPAGPRSKAKPTLLQSLTSTVLVEASDGTIEIRDSSDIKKPKRYNSPADALQKIETRPHLIKKRKKSEKSFDFPTETSPPDPPDSSELKKLTFLPTSPCQNFINQAHDQIPEEPIINSQKQRHISFYEQAQNIFADTSTESNDLSSRRQDSPLHSARERAATSSIPQRAQGVLASALRTYSLPRSCSRGSSVKSDTSVDSEESIVSVIPRKGNSITSDTSVDSEESVISVIQRSTSEIDTLGSQNGLRE
ncbi:uncharacterized protein CEXT_319431 [Caerostris extrusa]|uniref:Uncharacterized protein n=1 Tax=Caerostris extrusa TaxID=172846 RepID=A0AAV4UWF4_CAEEX|nr:uncharacterized protein CEXT_319431 [Caerostris extrusa]